MLPLLLHHCGGGDLRRRNVTVLLCKFLLRCGNENRSSHVAQLMAGEELSAMQRCSPAYSLIPAPKASIDRESGTVAWLSYRLIAKALALGFALAALWSSATPASAQVVLPPIPAIDSPWSAQRVFEPVPFAQRWEASGLGEILPEDTPVKTRLHPGYEPVGVRAGSWMFMPSLTLGALYNDNVFATPTNRQSDIALHVNPNLRAATLTEGNSVEIEADAHSASYRRNPGLDWIDAGIKARGRFELRHDITILTNFRVAKMHDEVGSLTSPTNAVEPTPYTYITGDATYLQQFNRLLVSGGMRIDSYDYGSTVAQNGSVINQDARDGQIYSGHGRIEYVFTPAFGVFAATEANRRELRGTLAQSLSSDGYRALAGVDVGLSRLVRGEFGIGYADQRFDAATIGHIVGPAYRAMLTWSPTRTVDVKFKAESIATQAVDTDASGIRADALQVGVNYEFRRNVVFSVAAIYEHDRFFGQSRNDNVYGTFAEVKYLLNRHWSISLRHQYLNRDSNIPTSTYDKHEIGINVTAQY